MSAWGQLTICPEVWDTDLAIIMKGAISMEKEILKLDEHKHSQRKAAALKAISFFANKWYSVRYSLIFTQL